jgi:hypothetical protein
MENSREMNPDRSLCDIGKVVAPVEGKQLFCKAQINVNIKFSCDLFVPLSIS